MELAQGQSFDAQRRFVRNLMRHEEYRDKGEEEIDSIINHRIKKFYVNDDYIEVDKEHFKSRLEPLYLTGVEPTNDTLLLFGVDFMSKQQLKAYFGTLEPKYFFLDESNCIIRFPSAENALQAIRLNLRADSTTKYKVQQQAEEGGEVGLHLNIPRTQPREWIQLQPYIYRFKKSKFSIKDYERRLYVRYATNKEMQMGFDRVSFLDGLINRCKLIWENEVRKDENLRVFLEGKMKSFRETISVMGQRSEKGRQQTHRSRSRDKPKASYISPQETFNTSKRAHLVERAEGDLSLEIRSRSDNTQEFQQLMNEFQQLNMEGASFIGGMSMFKEKGENESGFSGAPEVGYRVVQPAQLRVEYKNDRFNYKKYVLDSIERDEKKKKVTVVDLTDD